MKWSNIAEDWSTSNPTSRRLPYVFQGGSQASEEGWLVFEVIHATSRDRQCTPDECRSLYGIWGHVLPRSMDTHHRALGDCKSMPSKFSYPA